MKRTAQSPEGPRWFCAFCQALVLVVPTAVGDATCPKCGGLLWQNDRIDAVQQLARLELLALGASVSYDTISEGWAVDVRRSQITDSLMRLLLPLQPMVEVIAVDAPLTDKSMAVIGACESLEVLDLGGTRIGDLALGHIARLHRLEVLSLFETDITDAGLVLLNSLKKLRYLDLDRTNIAGEHFGSLRFLRRLETLSLVNTRVDDGVVPYLAQLKNLDELFLRGSRISNKARRRLMRTLRECEID